MQKDYSASNIQILKGLEAVRKRPGMYIGTTGEEGLHHLVYEIVDNSIDEALAGYCDQVDVFIEQGNIIKVEDNGRGIPTDIHPEEGISALEVVLTKLHAGGKFDKNSYKVSGGLHGVGVSVVNALSEWLEVTVYRNGKIFYQRYKRGIPEKAVAVLGETERTGTVVRFKPDGEIFKDTQIFKFDILSSRLRELSFLNKGIKINITDFRTPVPKENKFLFEGGVKSFVSFLNENKKPLQPEPIYFESEKETEKGVVKIEVAMEYSESYNELILSFVNNKIDLLGFVFIGNRCIQGRIAGQTPVHLLNVSLIYHQLLSNFLNHVGFQLAVFINPQAGLNAVQIVKKLFLRRFGTDLDQRPGAQDIVVDGGFYPPDGIGRQADFFI